MLSNLGAVPGKDNGQMMTRREAVLPEPWTVDV
jgi:hypothetical protein